ncbi:MAG: Asp-tRNA(Asn)/Glu-tRNA(Gln) amidotransferase subunit GatC [Aureliella sp.]
MSNLTTEDVAKVASLARLEIASDELEPMTQQLSKIIGFVEKLSELNTSDVEPMAHPLDVESVTRADVHSASLSRESALLNSPSHDGEFFLVPAVMAPKDS